MTVVVIGGGVIGLSAAYHLACAGADVELLESGSLGGGSSSRAAGGVRAQFSDEVNIRLGLRSLETFERFARDFDTEIDLHQVGYLFLLDDDADVATFTANVERQNHLGVPSRMIDVAEARRLSPLIETGSVKAAAYSPSDGHCTPESVVLGYARAARAAGVRIRTNRPATGIDVEDGAIVAVTTAAGPISADAVVCAAGAWSGRIGAWVGLDLPVRGLRRQIAVTAPLPDPQPTAFTIDFTSSFYFHREGPGMLLGLPEREDRWGLDAARSDDWHEDLAEAMARHIPRIGDVGIAAGWAGLYEMTPDHNGLIGAAEHLPGFVYATGFSGHGFLMGPAVGEVVRDLVLGRPPVIDVSALDVRRFGGSDLRFELNVV